MQKRNRFISRGPVGLCAVIALAGLGAGRASAASVFMWVASGSKIVGYSAGTNGTANSSTAVTGATLTAPTGGDYFSVATSGTSGTSENLYVADSGLHQLSEWAWNGTALTQVGSPVNFAADPAGGNISPQEIAIDASGNLWTTSIGGQIVKYNATLGTPTTEYAAGGALTGARGITISGTTAYVTVQGAYGSGSVYSFSTTSPGTPVLYASLSGMVGGQEVGQMRGAAVDEAGNIYYADSTWGAANTDEGYICKSATCTTKFTSALNGPNELETGLGTLAASGTTYDCDVLYEDNYYGGTIAEIATGYDTTGTTHSHCGDAEEGTSLGNFITGLTTPSGIALSQGESGLGGDSVPFGPTFISDPVTATPEPGTFAFMMGALLLAVGIGIRTQQRQPQ
jgi:hypothetical protein